MKKAMALVLSLMMMAAVFPACDSGSYEEGYQAGYEAGYQEGLQEAAGVPEGADIPQKTAEEVSILVWSKLGSILPEEYDTKQFQSSTRQARYIGDGKWEFTVTGPEEIETKLPIETVEESDVYWVHFRKKEVVTYDLYLTAYYYEDVDAVEFASVAKENEQTEVVTTSVEPMSALLSVERITWELFGAPNVYCLQGAIKNINKIPLYDISVVATLDGITEEEPVCDSLIYDQSAVFRVYFDLDAGYKVTEMPDYEFRTGLGSTIDSEINVSNITENLPDY